MLEWKQVLIKLKLNKICGASPSTDCLRLYTDALPLQKLSHKHKQENISKKLRNKQFSDDLPHCPTYESAEKNHKT